MPFIRPNEWAEIPLLLMMKTESKILKKNSDPIGSLFLRVF